MENRYFESILVTGGCGFIGANFIRHLLEGGHYDGRVVNIDKLTYAGNLENLAGIADRFEGRYHFVHGDICDGDLVGSIMEKHAIDAFCHFAAESHVDRSIAGPGAFVETNVNGTFALLEAARERSDKIKLFHHVSTDEVYGSLGNEGYFTEETAYDPSSPYSASKAASDHLMRAYHRTYGLPVTISNCSNNYGPYQFPEKLIPLMILNALDSKPLPVYGQGKNVRDWLYVEDHCHAIWQIMTHGRTGQTYNVGGRCEKTNLNVVESICDILEKIPGDSGRGEKRSLIQFVKDRPGHDHRYAINCDFIERELGWSPTVSFDQGLAKTIFWYMENQDWVRNVKSGDYRNWISQHYGKDRK
ncbi:MAG: dTDP-glucose 4,6-dehydratase [Desulfobacterales bacterium]|nr:dTDP-glucose 4,6-dehydratase [Desulfobacterales bacterium]